MQQVEFRLGSLVEPGCSYEKVEGSGIGIGNVQNARLIDESFSSTQCRRRMGRHPHSTGNDGMDGFKLGPRAPAGLTA